MFKRELGEAALDFVLVCVAYLGAFVLHYGFPNPAAPGPDPYAAMPGMLSASLAFVLVVKMSLLLVFQAYRGMWRYLGIADLMTLAKVTVLSSADPGRSGCRSWCAGVIIPRSVLVIDFLLFTVPAGRLAGVVRRAQRQLHSTPESLAAARAHRRRRRPRASWCCDRSFARDRPLYRPVGFLDPDPATRNRTLHSVRVLGTPDDLASVTGQHDVDLVVLALAPAYAEWPSGCASAARRWACPRSPRRHSSRCTSRGCPCCPRPRPSRSGWRTQAALPAADGRPRPARPTRLAPVGLVGGCRATRGARAPLRTQLRGSSWRSTLRRAAQSRVHDQQPGRRANAGRVPVRRPRARPGARLVVRPDGVAREIWASKVARWPSSPRCCRSCCPGTRSPSDGRCRRSSTRCASRRRLCSAGTSG